MTLPPLHPRCRCAIAYREVKIDALVTPPTKPTGIVSPPFSLGACKTFEEFKIYWAENYNVKVSNEISKLHFESVQTATAGIEAVLKEFLPAGRYLKEIGTYPEGIMTTFRGLGKINFNPEYFTDEKKLTAAILTGVETGFYPKNMTALGVGAHEAGHITEDWLIKKFHSVHTEYRPIPRRLVREAYQKAQLTAEGKGKSLEVLAKEIANYANENPSECLASAVSDYMTNGAGAKILSRMIWQRLKEELVKMLAPGVLKMVEFTVEEREKYGVFDEDGWLIGIKEDAPAEFKEAWEQDKKIEAELWERGID